MHKLVYAEDTLLLNVANNEGLKVENNSVQPTDEENSILSDCLAYKSSRSGSDFSRFSSDVSSSPPKLLCVALPNGATFFYSI